MARLSNKYNPLLKTYPESEKINSVSEGAEVLYVRLIAASDDASRYWGDAGWVQMRLFTSRALSGQITKEEVERRLVELESSKPAPLIRRYWVGGERYLQMIDVQKSLRNDVEAKIFFPEEVTETGTGPHEPVPPTETSTSALTKPNVSADVNVNRNGADARAAGAAVDDDLNRDRTGEAIQNMPDWSTFEWGSIVESCKEMRAQFRSNVGLGLNDREEILKVRALVKAGIIPQEFVDDAVTYSRGRSIKKPFAAFHGSLRRQLEDRQINLNRLFRAVKVPEKLRNPRYVPANSES